MKKGLIKEAFRLQQIAGIVPINEINEEVGSKYIKITGGSRGEIEDVEIVLVPGDPDTYLQKEFDSEINFRTDNGESEEDVAIAEEFADFSKVSDGVYSMVFNEEESAGFVSAELPEVKAYMNENGYDSVESLVEYLLEEADSAEVYEFLDQIGLG